MSKKRPMTAAELMASLNADAEYQDRASEKERSRQERQKALDQLFEPYLKKLHRLGFHGDSLEQIVRVYSPLPEPVVNVLLSALAGIAEPRVLESVVRALGASERPFDGSALAQCFESTDDEALKWAIANTVALARPHSIDDWLLALRAMPHWNKALRELGLDLDGG